MKFKIRFAEQIVGFFIVAALVVLVFVIIMLGSKQRWFAKDYYFRTYLDSAAGLGDNMVVQYRGFPIGNIKSFGLTDEDMVEVIFSIYDKYVSRVRQGSLVELRVSPIGLGNQFVFYSGLGEELQEEGSLVPMINSPQAANLIRMGLARMPVRDDNIAQLLAQVDGILGQVNTELLPGLGVILQDLDDVLVEVKEAAAGTDKTSLGRTLGGIDHLVNGGLEPILGDIKGITRDLETLSAQLVDPDGVIAAVLDTEGSVYTNLESSLRSISGALGNLEKTTALLPAQAPGMIAEVRDILRSAEEVITALLNNPLLKNGVAPRVDVRTGGTNPRDVSF
ncbi:MAG: MlaD family protein [Spirochaetaceae bacterium]|jgi:phospholipid/cholesterol/gamma-HCH transport system substrate-binding protein|nr:MlaD family protein [Spirochaetaceae bacterium]